MRISLAENWNLAFEKAVEILEKGGVIIYPTDTLYGIGGNALAKDVVERVYKIKKRERNKPLSVAVADLEMLFTFFEIGEGQLYYLTKYLPGPYTFLLQPKVPMPVSNSLVGVRVPNHFFLRRVIKRVGFPVITTSANLSGKPSPSCVDEIDEEIVKEVELIIDGGKTMYAAPSTVVDLVNKRIIRKGVGEFKF